MCKWDQYCILLGAKCCYAEKKWQSCPGLTKRKQNTKTLLSSKAPENQKHRLGFFFFFLLAAHMACRILVLWPGTEPMPPAVESQSLSLWNTRGFPWFFKFSQKLPQRQSVQFSSVTQLCPTLCDPMNRSTPGFPVHHQLPEFTQTHVHSVGDAIQPSHPLSSPSLPTFNLPQHQSLF